MAGFLGDVFFFPCCDHACHLCSVINHAEWGLGVGDEHRRGSFAGREFIMEGTLFPQVLPEPSKSLGQPSLAVRAAVCPVGQEHESWAGQSGDPPVAQERGLACRRPPSLTPLPQGLEPKHRRALCRVTRGQQGETALAELSHKPQFLSVVLKESGESADCAVLLPSRTVRPVAPGRERGEARREATSSSASSHLPGFKCPIC